MEDTAWTGLTEPHERLKWARLNAGFPTARSAAESLGMLENTYSAYERAPDKSKATPLDHQSAMRFGKKFKVSWTWLLVREGSPFSRPMTEPQRRTLEMMSTVDEEAQQRVAAVAETMLRKSA
jgi:hypothetical protein